MSRALLDTGAGGFQILILIRKSKAQLKIRVSKTDLQFISCIYFGCRRRVVIWSFGAHLSTKCARANHCSFIGIFSSAPSSVRPKNKQGKITTKIDLFESRPAAREI